ncbi:MAG: hypothetical protein BWY31_00279 [Lentisphaerae bacterium ADurb.Bin242]|nr:MAG: hypothetical protein BWY31_00279 [Lentisphaerae bacterium ADurb.Bin242]
MKSGKLPEEKSSLEINATGLLLTLTESVRKRKRIPAGSTRRNVGTDGVIIHTANRDRHREQAEFFLDAGKSVFLDKPFAGNPRDVFRLLNRLRNGVRLTGGSSLRYCRESAELLAFPEAERGRIHTVCVSIGNDEFNYGIHGYSMICGILGGGSLSARFLPGTEKKQIFMRWSNGAAAFLTLAKPAALPFNAAVTTDKKLFRITVDNRGIYRSLLRKTLPYLTGMSDVPPTAPESLFEPELLAMAARKSWENGGAEMFLRDLRPDDPGYDGHKFAAEYRRSRFPEASLCFPAWKKSPAHISDRPCP